MAKSRGGYVVVHYYQREPALTLREICFVPSESICIYKCPERKVPNPQLSGLCVLVTSGRPRRKVWVNLTEYKGN